MAIMVNDTSIPTNGNYISVGGVNIDKVICNGVEVWKKITSIDIPTEEVSNYVEITNDDGYINTCPVHGTPAFDCIIWNIDGTATTDSLDRTYTVKPKEPYTKIKATFHRCAGNLVGNIWANVNDNGLFSNMGQYAYGNYLDETITVEAAQIVVRMHVDLNSTNNHWQGGISVCMHSVSLST